jgi:hypothetical protein
VGAPSPSPALETTTLDISAEPLASLLIAAEHAEKVCWLTAPADDYFAELDKALRELLADCADIAWVSLDPTTGSVASAYPRWAAEALEAEYRALRAETQRAAEHGASPQAVGSVHLGERFYNATVHLNAVGQDQILYFQTTPSGGHRSVQRCKFGHAAEPAEEGEADGDGRASVDSPSSETFRHSPNELPIHMTTSGEWSFTLPGSSGPPRSQIEPTIVAEAPEQAIVFSASWLRVPERKADDGAELTRRSSYGAGAPAE